MVRVRICLAPFALGPEFDVFRKTLALRLQQVIKARCYSANVDASDARS
jgi:hypothetical protein